MTAVPATWLPLSQYAVFMEDYLRYLGYQARHCAAGPCCFIYAQVQQQRTLACVWVHNLAARALVTLERKMLIPNLAGVNRHKQFRDSVRRYTG